MKNLLDKGTKCLIVQSEFSEFSFWNYVDICKITGAKYPAAPLGLLTVAALLPQHWEFKLIDANVEPLLAEHFEWADIVCMGGMLPQQQSMLTIIDKAHQHGCPVVVGGPDPSSQPNFYQAADYLVQGEGEVTIPMLIEDLENGITSGEYKSDEFADMTKAVVPRFDLIRFQDYIQVGVQYSRGCPFNCEFCDVIELYGRKARTKTSEQIIKELQTLYDLGHRGHIDFVDDNFIGNKKNVKKVLPDIIEWSKANNYPYYFSTESSINMADDEDLLQMMRDIDFRYVFVGIETPDDEILRLNKKYQNVNKPITEAVNKISSYGMIVNGGYIIGFDNETDQTAEKMIQSIQDSGVCMAMVGKLYGLPETQLTRRLKREGRLFEKDSTIRDTDTQLDQMTSGLNFITSRPRLDVLNDYLHIIKQIYDPERYYERVTHTSLKLKPANKFKPGILKMLKSLKAFLIVCSKVGFNKTTGWLYWKTLVKVISKNPKGIEAAVNLAAMFIHFQKQSKFIIELTNKEIKSIESCGEEKYHQLMFQVDKNSNDHKKSLKKFVNR
ncbi:MAG: B12-binding domain-containing radical SAM protein [Melioribacteraceae bacterium]|nr:B12-binding domain-containing radical SAM protein [Melioribacteraceae bacterium]